MDGNQERQQESGNETEGIGALGRKVAGIDVGSKEHWACAPEPEGVGREVKVFGATTPELDQMALWLKERKVESVALESTGVYWIPEYEVLERHGLEVVLVDTRQLARVPGRRKTDRRDCFSSGFVHSDNGSLVAALDSKPACSLGLRANRRSATGLISN